MKLSEFLAKLKDYPPETEIMMTLWDDELHEIESVYFDQVTDCLVIEG